MGIERQGLFWQYQTNVTSNQKHCPLKEIPPFSRTLKPRGLVGGFRSLIIRWMNKQGQRQNFHKEGGSGEANQIGGGGMPFRVNGYHKANGKIRNEEQLLDWIGYGHCLKLS